MKEELHVLLVDDNPDDRALVAREMRREFPKLRPSEVTDQKGFSRVLDGPAFDLVITDFHLRWTDGLEVLRHIKTRWPDCPVIMFTGTGSEEIAVAAMKAGLDDYVLKSPKHYARLPVVTKVALKLRQQRQRLRQAEARYGTLFNSVPIGLYRASPQGVILDANPAFAEMLGYPGPDRLLKMNLADLFFDAGEYQAWTKRMEEAGVIQHFEARLRTFSGGICWAENSARATPEPNAGLVYEACVEDITGRKEADEERERLILELQDALATVKTLSGLLPICASCKKIRDDNGYWNQIEVFIQSHSDAEFTHSFCPECVRRLYPEVFEGNRTVNS